MSRGPVRRVKQQGHGTWACFSSVRMQCLIALSPVEVPLGTIDLQRRVDLPSPHDGGRGVDVTVESKPGSTQAIEDAPSTRQEELRSFLFFTIVMAPALAVVLVAGYGFIVWMTPLIMGPPAS